MSQFFAAIWLLFFVSGVAAANDPSTPYLKYQEPQPLASSWFATGAYVFSLLATFLIIIGLAYFVSRFLGHKLTQHAGTGDSKVLSSLMLGPNRAVYVVEVAGKVLILGVTEQQITLLEEVGSNEEIAKLRMPQQSLGVGQFDSIFRRQLSSLQQMSNKFPAVFGSGSTGSTGSAERERADTQEKR